jgi:ketosteroid isomerase-like protein
MMSTAAERPLGRVFAEALSRKNFDQLLTILDPDVVFLGMTPFESWRASSARELVEDILPRWFQELDDIQQVISIETDAFSDCQHVAYRFKGENPDGPFEVEEQAYYTERDGRIDWLRILCSGFRPKLPAR